MKRIHHQLLKHKLNLKSVVAVYWIGPNESLLIILIHVKANAPFPL